jgi:hypothetical protein
MRRPRRLEDLFTVRIVAGTFPEDFQKYSARRFQSGEGEFPSIILRLLDRKHPPAAPYIPKRNFLWRPTLFRLELL